MTIEKDNSANVEQILQARAEALASRGVREGDQQPKTPYLVVSMGNESFGIELAELLETSQLGELTPIPGASSSLAGVTSCRGEIKAVYGLAEWLGTEPADVSKECFLLFFKRQADTGFIVNELADIYYFSQPDIENGTIDDSYANFCHASCEDIHLIDTNKVLKRLRSESAANQ